jgi:hypothetical protein
MGLWIAIFITLVVFGSILWVKPSPRERLVTEYRKQALGKGLKVRLLDEKLSTQLFPWIDNYRQFIFYEKALPSSAKPKSHKAIVIRVGEDPHAHEIDEVDSVKLALLEKVDFKVLPSTTEAIVISASGISVLWREYEDKNQQSPSFVDVIESFLIECSAQSKIWT